MQASSPKSVNGLKYSTTSKNSIFQLTKEPTSSSLPYLIIHPHPNSLNNHLNEKKWELPLEQFEVISIRMKSAKKKLADTTTQPLQNTTSKKHQVVTQDDTSGPKSTKFTALMSKKHLQILKEKLSEYYGKNFAISYKKNYAFDQEWQGFIHNDEQGEKQSIFQNQNSLYTVLLFVVMCFNTVMIWMNTIQTFFMNQNSLFNHPALFALGMVLEVAYAILKIGLSYRRPEERVTLIQILSKSYKNMVVFAYFLIKLVEADRAIPICWWFIIEGLCIFVMYKRARNIYSSFKLMNFALMYEYQFKITDIILNLIIIAHFISIILYESTKFGFEKTWIDSAGIQEESPMVKYIYSFYFCCTTILTVGYGDISPKNYAEVIVVTLVEIFGIIAFANFINQIGYSLSAIRKTNQNIEKELLVIQKMKKWYRMDEDLSKRARIHVINNKIMDSQLSPEEENGVMMKLSQELRHEIKDVNSLRIVKSSIFFLLRWSNSFQKAISLRLCNIMFPPGQLLYQPPGKERIYIVRQGKIDIYASKRGSKRGINTKILKTIENDLGQEVSNNIYGYTAVISRRPVQLYAVAKRHTSGYYIEKEKFLECIHERPTDFQFYHEFKNRIDESPCWQSIEVPHLDSSKYHYNPTHAYIFRKHNNQKTQQKRSYYERNMKRRTMVQINQERQGFVLLKKMHPTLDELTSSQLHFSKKSLKEILEETSQDLQCQNFKSEQIKHLHHHFESSKEYTNYLSNNNRSKVLKNWEIELGVDCNVEGEHVHSNFFDALKDYRNSMPNISN